MNIDLRSAPRSALCQAFDSHDLIVVAGPADTDKCQFVLSALPHECPYVVFSPPNGTSADMVSSLLSKVTDNPPQRPFDAASSSADCSADLSSNLPSGAARYFRFEPTAYSAPQSAASGSVQALYTAACGNSKKDTAIGLVLIVRNAERLWTHSTIGPELVDLLALRRPLKLVLLTSSAVGSWWTAPLQWQIKAGADVCGQSDVARRVAMALDCAAIVIVPPQSEVQLGTSIATVVGAGRLFTAAHPVLIDTTESLPYSLSAETVINILVTHVSIAVVRVAAPFGLFGSDKLFAIVDGLFEEELQHLFVHVIPPYVRRYRQLGVTAGPVEGLVSIMKGLNNDPAVPAGMLTTGGSSANFITRLCSAVEEACVFALQSSGSTSSLSAFGSLYCRHSVVLRTALPLGSSEIFKLSAPTNMLECSTAPAILPVAILAALQGGVVWAGHVLVALYVAATSPASCPGSFVALRIKRDQRKSVQQRKSAYAVELRAARAGHGAVLKFVPSSFVRAVLPFCGFDLSPVLLLRVSRGVTAVLDYLWSKALVERVLAKGATGTIRYRPLLSREQTAEVARVLGVCLNELLPRGAS